MALGHFLRYDPRMPMQNEKLLKPPELLAPAGNMEKLITAIHYGADAVYLGDPRYSLRAHASNFSAEELRTAVDYAHAHGVKAYVTVNIFAHQRDLLNLAEYLCFVKEIGADAVIISDPGILRKARRVVPELPIHLSTQANVTNEESALFWREQGVCRVNLARELSLAEVAAIKKAVPLAIEVFVHGAICISYSGRCLLSSYLTGRDANRGACAQPCRYSYALVEEKRPGQFFALEEDSRGAFIFNARDLCLLDRLPELWRAGVDSLKIEGRMKGIFYVGSVVRVYRAALDALAANRSGPDEALKAALRAEIDKVGTRGFTENFCNGPAGPESMLYEAPRAAQEYLLAGVVRAVRPGLRIEVRNPIRPGDLLEFLGRGLTSFFFTVQELISLSGEKLEQANPGNLVEVRTVEPSPSFAENGLVRKSTT